MSTLKIFTDASVNPKTGIGFGAALFLSQSLASQTIPPLENLNSQIKIRQFESTSSTRLELQTLLWALSYIDKVDSKVQIYTDCQNLLGLQTRRNQLEKNHFRSSKNQLLKNADLYQQYFRLSDRMEVELIKIDGHKKSTQRDENDHLFSLVDKACRKALRHHICEPAQLSHNP